METTYSPHRSGSRRKSFNLQRRLALVETLYHLRLYCWGFWFQSPKEISTGGDHAGLNLQCCCGERFQSPKEISTGGDHPVARRTGPLRSRFNLQRRLALVETSSCLNPFPHPISFNLQRRLALVETWRTNYRKVRRIRFNLQRRLALVETLLRILRIGLNHFLFQSPKEISTGGDTQLQ